MPFTPGMVANKGGGMLLCGDDPESEPGLWELELNVRDNKATKPLYLLKSRTISPQRDRGVSLAQNMG